MTTEQRDYRRATLVVALSADGYVIAACECDALDEHTDTTIALFGTGDIDTCARCARHYRLDNDGNVYTWTNA